MRPSDILYENGDFWVSRGQQFGKGFEVYKVNGTHSVRIAIIGFEGQHGLDRAKTEADRRAGAVAIPSQDHSTTTGY